MRVRILLVALGVVVCLAIAVAVVARLAAEVEYGQLENTYRYEVEAYLGSVRKRKGDWPRDLSGFVTFVEAGGDPEAVSLVNRLRRAEKLFAPALEVRHCDEAEIRGAVVFHRPDGSVSETDIDVRTSEGADRL